MEKASRVFYSIANFFTWIIVILSLAGIVFSILAIADIFDLFNGALSEYGIGTLILFIVWFVVGLITIAMVRRAKAQGSSKGWDLLFMILGIVGGNIFYFFGGLFGLIAVRR